MTKYQKWVFLILTAFLFTGCAGRKIQKFQNKISEIEQGWTVTQVIEHMEQKPIPLEPTQRTLTKEGPVLYYEFKNKIVAIQFDEHAKVVSYGYDTAAEGMNNIANKINDANWLTVIGK